MYPEPCSTVVPAPHSEKPQEQSFGFYHLKDFSKFPFFSLSLLLQQNPSGRAMGQVWGGLGSTWPHAVLPDLANNAEAQLTLNFK